MGTERLIHSQPDILPDFFELMHGFKVPCPLQLRMFPNCLSMPGWQHGWDLMMRRALLALPFFPSFIAGLRAVVSFFRAPLLVDVLVRDICSRGYNMIGDMVKALKVPSIAEWRWGTVAAACGALNSIMSTLRSYFSDKLYKNARDPTLIQKTRNALQSDSWKCVGSVTCLRAWQHGAKAQGAHRQMVAKTLPTTAGAFLKLRSTSDLSWTKHFEKPIRGLLNPGAAARSPCCYFKFAFVRHTILHGYATSIF